MAVHGVAMPSLLNNPVEIGLYEISGYCFSVGMAGTSEILTICGIEIPAEERTPLVEALLRGMGELLETNRQLKLTVLQQGQRVEQLEQEIGRLKGLPEKPKHKPQPARSMIPAARRPPAAGRSARRPTENGPVRRNVPRPAA